MLQPITNLDSITPAWVTEVLRKNGILSQGRVVSVERGAGQDARSVIIPLTLDYDDAAPVHVPERVIFKMPAGEIRPGNNPEVLFYSTLGDSKYLPVIRCLDAVEDPKTGAYHLLLEDLSETHIAYPPSQLPPYRNETEQIVDALADLHIYWWDNARLGSKIGEFPTPKTIRYQIEKMEERYYLFADFLDDRLPVVWQNIYQRLFRALPDLLIRRLASRRNLTMIHGDPHVGNFLYPKNPEQDSLRILDWKSYSIDIGVDDMAHMMAVFWFSERRAQLEQPMLRRYYHQLKEKGIQRYQWEDCARDYRLAIARFLLYPIWQWDQGVQPDIWWNHLHRIFTAFFDQGCNALLE